MRDEENVGVDAVDAAIRAAAETVVAVPVPEKPKLLAMSIFDDPTIAPLKGGAVSYTASVDIRGTTFRFVMLTGDQLEHYRRESLALAREAKSLEKTTETEVQIAATTALCAHGSDLNHWVIEQALLDWENPNWESDVPCNSETRAAMTLSVTTELSDEIVSLSQNGRSGRGFLAQS